MAGKAAGKLSTARSDLSELRKSLSAGMGPRYAAPFRRRFCRAAGCIGQSAGADHAQQICACAAALQTETGAAQARSFPGRSCPTGFLLPESAGSCRYITRCTRSFLQIRSCMRMKRRSWCCGSRSGRHGSAAIYGSTEPPAMR